MLKPTPHVSGLSGDIVEIFGHPGGILKKRGLDGGRWRIGYAEHARACKSVRVLLSSFRMLRGAALPRAVELSPDGMGVDTVRIGVTAQATAMRSGVCLGAR